MNITVKHVASKEVWDKPKDGSSSWIEYWEKYSGFKLSDFCRDCHKKISNHDQLVGAHVKKTNSIDNDIYIVPVHNSCNVRGASDGHEFECDERILVHANYSKIKKS